MRLNLSLMIERIELEYSWTQIKIINFQIVKISCDDYYHASNKPAKIF